MTEYEWLACEKPLLMLRRLQERDAGLGENLNHLCRKKLGWSNVVVTTESMRHIDKPSCDLIREVVGNPFRPIYHVKDYLNDPRANYHVQATAQTSTRKHQELIKELNNRIFLPEWLTPRVQAFAQGIVDSERYCDVPVLADLLEEVGCDNEEILRHLRQEVWCPECKGTGEYWKKSYDGSGPFPFQCTDCKTTGWLPKPVPCQKGCWALRLITEVTK